MSKLRIGIIGLGYWGPNLVRNFNKLEGVEVKAIADVSSQRLGELSDSYPSISVVTKDPYSLIESNKIDSVVIATPVHTHFKLAKKSLESGKHVFVEKPITLRVSEAEELIDLASRKKLILMVDHTFVYSAPVKKIKEFIDNGSIGELHYIDSTRINLGLFQSDVNVIWDLAPHDFSIINFLTGKKPVSLSAHGIKHPQGSKESLAYLTIRYPDNLLAHVNVSWFSPVKLRTILMGGTKKMIIYDDIQPSEKVKVYDYGVEISKKKGNPFNPVYRSGDIWIPKVEPRETLEEVCKHFIDSITKNKKPLTGGGEGLEVVKLLEAADKSLELNGSEIKVV